MIGNESAFGRKWNDPSVKEIDFDPSWVNGEMILFSAIDVLLKPGEQVKTRMPVYTNRIILTGTRFGIVMTVEVHRTEKRGQSYYSSLPETMPKYLQRILYPYTTDDLYWANMILLGVEFSDELNPKRSANIGDIIEQLAEDLKSGVSVVTPKEPSTYFAMRDKDGSKLFGNYLYSKNLSELKGIAGQWSKGWMIIDQDGRVHAESEDSPRQNVHTGFGKRQGLPFNGWPICSVYGDLGNLPAGYDRITSWGRNESGQLVASTN